MILFKIVAPCAGAWIEICLPCGVALYRATSLPVRERGLKWIDLLLPACVRLSLPVRERGLKFAYPAELPSTGQRRSLCGSVD